MHPQTPPPTSSSAASPVEAIRRHLRQGERALAHAALAGLLGETCGRAVHDVRVNDDAYSLNSVNGFARLEGGTALFFKFHQEDGELDGVSEYYNARALAEVGYPVEVPLFAATEPGRQILVYERSRSVRLADACAAVERGSQDVSPDASPDDLVGAQRRLDEICGRLLVDSLHEASLEQGASEPVFQLFHHRLIDEPSLDRPIAGSGGTARGIGGRAARFHEGRQVRWPGLETCWDDVRDRPWRIDGLDYPLSLGAAFERARGRLAPEALFPGPATVAHGDAHNANVWYHRRAGVPPTLSLFDPAFAGHHVPALLAEIKATFHNVFAHPFWLYEPDEATARFRARARLDGDTIVVETDYRMGPLRHAFLDAKAELVWRPLLAALAARGWLVDDWEAVLRLALFTCPTLVMPLLPGPDSTHTPTSSLLGFAQAVRMACPPAHGGEDDASAFFAAIAPDGGGTP